MPAGGDERQEDLESVVVLDHPRLEQGLKLQAVEQGEHGDGYRFRGQDGVGPRAGLLGADRCGHARADAAVAIDEPGVGWVVGLDGFGGEHGVEPGDLGVLDVVAQDRGERLAERPVVLLGEAAENAVSSWSRSSRTASRSLTLVGK